MSMLVAITIRLSLPSGSTEAIIQPMMSISRKLKKLSMLDVSIMGVVVVVMSLRNLSAKGVIISMRYGLVVMLAAEACHYLAFHVVSSASKTASEDVLSKEKESSSGADGASV